LGSYLNRFRLAKKSDNKSADNYMDLNFLTVVELRSLLKTRGIMASGGKSDLVGRGPRFA
jgi:hypothetical protein